MGTLVHDAQERLTRLTPPGGGDWQWQYNAASLPVQQTDPLGRITQWIYNSLGLPSKVREAVGTAQERARLYRYDAAGPPRSTTRPAS